MVDYNRAQKPAFKHTLVEDLRVAFWQRKLYNSTMTSYLKIITPTNLATEEERFFSLEDYSPRLEYDWNDQDLKEFVQGAPQGEPLAKALLSQDGEALTTAASAFFDVKFREGDIKLAQSLVAHPPVSSDGTAEECAQLMRQKLARLGIDYTVEVVDQRGFQCRPSHRKRVLKLSKYMHLQFPSLDSITNHELVHIIRAVNGEYNHISASKRYLPTEEGLACLVQDEMLKCPTASSFQHALEYLAAYLSQTSSFREVYNFFIEHGSDPKNAWLRGIRQKFGLKDTSKPGGLVKSGMYFYHENLLRSCSQSELLRLFVGKISLADLPAYPEYVGKIPREAILELLAA